MRSLDALLASLALLSSVAGAPVLSGRARGFVAGCALRSDHYGAALDPAGGSRSSLAMYRAEASLNVLDQPSETARMLIGDLRDRSLPWLAGRPPPPPLALGANVVPDPLARLLGVGQWDSACAGLRRRWLPRAGAIATPVVRRARRGLRLSEQQRRDQNQRAKEPGHRHQEKRLGHRLRDPRQVPEDDHDEQRTGRNEHRSCGPERQTRLGSKHATSISAPDVLANTSTVAPPEPHQTLRTDVERITPSRMSRSRFRSPERLGIRRLEHPATADAREPCLCGRVCTGFWDCVGSAPRGRALISCTRN